MKRMHGTSESWRDLAQVVGMLFLVNALAAAVNLSTAAAEPQAGAHRGLRRQPLGRLRAQADGVRFRRSCRSS